MEDGFEERKKKHEEKWAHDEALRFKALARRNKLFGQWAARELGLSGTAAEEYTKTVVTVEVHNPALGVFGKVKEDFRAAGLPHSEDLLRRKFVELAELARVQVQNG
jgi:hypothetical protein